MGAPVFSDEPTRGTTDMSLDLITEGELQITHRTTGYPDETTRVQTDISLNMFTSEASQSTSLQKLYTSQNGYYNATVGIARAV